MSDTTQIIVTILGVGIALAGLMRHDTKTLNARIDSLAGALNSRIDAMEGRMNSRIDALSSRIDNLYQALFSRKAPAA